MLHFIHMENMSLKPNQPVESVGLTDTRTFLIERNEAVQATEKFIAGLTEMIESGKGKEDQMRRWQKDILKARIDLVQMEEELSHELTDSANEILGKEQGTA
jgi:hypothetical protein